MKVKEEERLEEPRDMEKGDKYDLAPAIGAGKTKKGP